MGESRRVEQVGRIPRRPKYFLEVRDAVEVLAHGQYPYHHLDEKSYSAKINWKGESPSNPFHSFIVHGSTESRPTL